MKRKGFTLIELLAVIIIVAVIAIITIPMILNVIEDSRKGAAESSAYGYLEALDKAIVTEEIISGTSIEKERIYMADDVEYEYSDLEYFDEHPDFNKEASDIFLNSVVKIKGQKPTAGYVIIGKKEIEEAELVINGYVVYCDSSRKCVSTGKFASNSNVTNIEIEELESYVVTEGNIITLKAKAVTIDGAEAKITWASSDEEIATVDKNGVVTCFKTGTVTILASSGNKTSRVTITIVNDSILGYLEDTNLKNDSIIEMNINGEKYNAHVYTFDGDTIFDTNRQFGDANDVATASANAKNMVIVKVNGNLTINSGVKIEPYYNAYGGPKGFILYVTGTLTNNGTIDNSHGAKAAGQNVYLWKNADGTYEYVPATGGAGGAAPGGSSAAAGIAGSPGTGRQTGGGGSGGKGFSPNSGAGSKGTSYSGGTGGGGAGWEASASGGAGAANGGSGGIGRNANVSGSNTSYKGSGGAGNPGGKGPAVGSVGTASSTGSNGTGGLLILYANNYINNGNITSNGSNGGADSNGGGSSGGGSINIFTNQSTGIDQLGIITNTKYSEIKGTTNILGGLAVGTQSKGGAGGNGTVNIGEIRNGQYYDLKEIIEQDKQAYIESVTIRGDSILSILETNNLKSGYYFFVANGVNYSVHLYTFDFDTIFSSSRKFGDANDVATASSNAQNMVIVKVNGNLTINSGVKIEPYYNAYGGPKGFILYVTGTLTNNGTIDNSHGAKAAGQNVYLWKNADGTYEYVPATGGAGGAAPGGSSAAAGIAGSPGTGRQTGGGGSGGKGFSPNSGAGSKGTSYSGGTGGGGAGWEASASGGAGAANGGSGGIGRNANVSGSNTSYKGSGGAGNPGGKGPAVGSVGTASSTGSNGTGGLLTIYANNYINNGKISAIGANGGTDSNGGGSSGGGSINVFYGNTLTKGTVQKNGGSAVGTQSKGGAGGAGTVTYTKI